MGRSPGDVGELSVTYVKRQRDCRISRDEVTRQKGYRMSCDVGEATEGLENAL